MRTLVWFYASFFLRTFAAYIFSWEIKNCLKPLLLWCQGCDSQEHRERWKGLFFPTHHTCVTLSPLHDIGGNTSPPESFALCPCLQLAQSKAHFLGICLEASWPGVFWPLSLVIPCQGLSCDAGYSVCPIDPCILLPVSGICWEFSSKADVTLVWEWHLEDSSQTTINNRLHSVEHSLCHP